MIRFMPTGRRPADAGNAALVLIFSFACAIPTAQAFNEPTHSELTLAAIRSHEAQTGPWLAKALGFADSWDQKLRQLTVRDILRAASVDEDFPEPRVLNHFLDPTVLLQDAGLRLPLIDVHLGPASAIWALEQSAIRAAAFGAEGSFGFDHREHSWRSARHRFLEGLTASTALERENAFAEMFVDLGHVIHLLEDTASPAHTRNDFHAPLLDAEPDGRPDVFSGLRHDQFHKWAEGYNVSTFPPVSPDPAIFGLPPNPPATVPVASLFDTGRLFRDRRPRTGVDIGLAEYSNANFYSDDTVSSYDYPVRSERFVDVTDPTTGIRRRYFYRVTGGGEPQPLGTPSALLRTECMSCANPHDVEVGLDNVVLRSYASLLMPRAVGYSAAAIDYFFRGRIEIDASLATILSIAATPSDKPLASVDLSLRIPDGGSTAGYGTVRAIIEYGPSGAGDDDSRSVFRASGPTNVSKLDESKRDLSFGFTPGQIPDGFEVRSLSVVFSGEMEGEVEGVAVGRLSFASRVQVGAPEGHIFGTAHFGPGEDEGEFRRLRIRVKLEPSSTSDTSDSEGQERVDASVQAALRYDDPSGSPKIAASSTIEHEIGSEQEDVEVSFETTPMPSNANDVKLFLAARSRESGEVSLTSKRLHRPKGWTFVNDTDYSWIGWNQVTNELLVPKYYDLMRPFPEPAGFPSPEEQREIDTYNVMHSLHPPVVYRDVRFKMYPGRRADLKAAVEASGRGDYSLALEIIGIPESVLVTGDITGYEDFYIPELKPGEIARMFVLVDGDGPSQVWSGAFSGCSLRPGSDECFAVPTQTFEETYMLYDPSWNEDDSFRMESLSELAGYQIVYAPSRLYRNQLIDSSRTTSLEAWACMVSRLSGFEVQCPTFPRPLVSVAVEESEHR